MPQLPSTTCVTPKSTPIARSDEPLHLPRRPLSTSFRWKDYRNANQQKVMTLDAGEFIRRFLVHVLPEGFQRIRYYGFMGNRYRKQKLARCRELLGMQQSDTPAKPKEGRDFRDKVEELTGVSLRECPFCRQGQMVCIEVLAPVSSPDPPFLDTS
jgi:hypothetical protein